MYREALLAAWSAAGVAWWITSWWLVKTEARVKAPGAPAADQRSITIFKPLPPLGARGLQTVARGVASFVAQLDPGSEMLLGVHKADRDTVAPLVDELQAKYPKAQVRVIYRSEPDRVANPKIAWQIYLAPHASGELWLWSDADIVAPPQFVQGARDEFAKGGAAMLTFPYVMGTVARPSALFEALFVNADLYPGVVLLRKMGAVDFGLGAAMLFEREEFEKRVDWNDLGGFLADDFQLGQRLRPVRIGTVTLETVAGERAWPDALRHDLRWAKTIRWSRPGGFFARLLVLPVLGWLLAVAADPTQILAWAGLVGMIQADVLAAAAICREIGCRLKGRDVAILECWGLWRVVAWVVAWMPGRVSWTGRIWRRPREEMVKLTQASP